MGGEGGGLVDKYWGCVWVYNRGAVVGRMGNGTYCSFIFYFFLQL